MDTTRVMNNPAKRRYELIEGGAVAGYAEYRLAGDEIMFTHTEVAAEHEGKGYASELARQALADASAQTGRWFPFAGSSQPIYSGIPNTRAW